MLVFSRNVLTFHAYLAVEIEDVEREDADFDLHVLDLDILPLSRHKLLEWQHLLLNHVPGDCFAVKDKALGALLDPRWKLG